MMEHRVQTLPTTDILDIPLAKESSCTSLIAEEHQDRKNHCSGFTLIELAIVVAIIGILATLGATFFVSARRTAQEISVKHDLRSFVSAQEFNLTDNGKYLGNPGETTQSGGGDFSVPSLNLSPGVVITVVSGDPDNPHSQTDPYIAEATHIESAKVFEYNGWTNNITEKGN